MKSFLRSFSSLPLYHSRRVVVSDKRKYGHEELVNRLFKLAQEKVWIGELTVSTMTIAVELGVKQQNKQAKLYFVSFAACHLNTLKSLHGYIHSHS